MDIDRFAPGRTDTAGPKKQLGFNADSLMVGTIGLLQPVRDREGIQRLLHNRIEKAGLDVSDHIVVLSRYTQAKFLAVYRVPAGKITVIPGAVDLKRFHPVKDKRGVRACHRLYFRGGPADVLSGGRPIAQGMQFLSTRKILTDASLRRPHFKKG